MVPTLIDGAPRSPFRWANVGLDIVGLYSVTERRFSCAAAAHWKDLLVAIDMSQGTTSIVPISVCSFDSHTCGRGLMNG
jgi:hypothetical protein